MYEHRTHGHDYITRGLPLKNEQGEIHAALIVSYDISERKKAEEALRVSEEKFSALFRASPAAFLIVKADSPKFTITEVNEAYLSATMRNYEDVIGRGIFEAFPDNPDDKTINGASSLRASFERVLISRQPDRLPFLKYDIARPDGTFEERWWSPVNSPVLDRNGEVETIIHNATDVTEEHRALVAVRESEEKLLQFNQLLEQQVAERTSELMRTNKELESFSYIASHDLQEPLRKIQTFINLIEKSKFEKETTAKHFERIKNSAERMSKLIQSVLTYSRLTKRKEEFIEVDLNNVLADVRNEYELLITEKQAKIKSGKLPIINANALQMHQLFSNLISNSIKCSKVKPEIKISAKEVSGKQVAVTNGSPKPNETLKFIQLTFTDNGIGFAPAFKEKIFEVFQRLHGKTEYSGTGIGLSIVKKIVEEHGGYIKAESKEGDGAEFTIALPKKPSSRQATLRL